MVSTSSASRSAGPHHGRSSGRKRRNLLVALVAVAGLSLCIVLRMPGGGGVSGDHHSHHHPVAAGDRPVSTPSVKHEGHGEHPPAMSSNSKKGGAKKKKVDPATPDADDDHHGSHRREEVPPPTTTQQATQEASPPPASSSSANTAGGSSDAEAASKPPRRKQRDAEDDGQRHARYCAASAVPKALRHAELHPPHNVDAVQSLDVSPWRSAVSGHQWAFSLEGADPVEGVDADQIARHPLGGGFHCAVLRDTGGGCIAATQPFIVTERSRGGTEYAVPPGFLRRLPLRVAPVTEPTAAVREREESLFGGLSTGSALHGAVKLTAAVSTSPVGRVKSGSARAAQSFRNVATRLARKAGSVTSSNHLDVGLMLRFTPVVPHGTLGVGLVTLTDLSSQPVRRKSRSGNGGGNARRSRRGGGGAQQGDNDESAPDKSGPGSDESDSSLLADFVRVYLHAPPAPQMGEEGDESAETPPPPFVPAGATGPEALDITERFTAPDADDWTVDVHGGMGAVLLRPPDAAPRSPWLPEHQMEFAVDRDDSRKDTEQYEFTLDAFPSASSLKDGVDAPKRGHEEVEDPDQLDETPVKPAMHRRVVHAPPLKKFAAVDDFDGLKSALEAEACRVRAQLDSPVKTSHCWLYLKSSIDIPAKANVVLPAGTVVASESGAMVRVVGSLTALGTLDAPVLFTRARAMVPSDRTPVGSAMLNERSIHAGNWGGITVREHGQLHAEHTIFAFAGGSTKRAKGTGTHIKDACPIVVAEAGSKVNLTSAALVHSKGPGIGAGEKAKVRVASTLFYNLAQGGECVGCSVTIVDSVFSSFMLRPKQRQFIDRDNDGFYFRGGHATVRGSTFANMMDDCIDTASSKGDKEHSSLRITGSILANCLHEGLALSASVGTQRSVSVSNSLIAWAQQGIENGYTPAGHHCDVSRVTFLGNALGLRYGDNYDLDIKGRIQVAESLFVNNGLDVLTAVKHALKHRNAIAAHFGDGLATDDGSPGAKNVEIERSAFSTQLRAARASKTARRSNVLKRGAKAGLVQDAELAAGDDASDRTCDAGEDDVDSVHYQSPALSRASTTVDVSQGTVCGLRHFVSNDNAEVTRPGDSHEVGCAHTELCGGLSPGRCS